MYSIPMKRKTHFRLPLAILTVVVMLVSLMTVATAAEPSVAEQRLQAQAIARSAQSLRLSATALELKAGDTYELKVLPEETAKAMDWRFDEEKLAVANSSFLKVENIDQDTMTVTVKATRSGGNVPVRIELTNPTLMELAKNHSSLMTYVRLAQNSLQQYMVCQVATNDTATKVVAGVEAPVQTTVTPAVSTVVSTGGSSSSSGGSGTIQPPQQPEEPINPDNPGTGGNQPGGNQPGGTEPGGSTGGSDDGSGNDPGTTPPPVEVVIPTTPDPDSGDGTKTTVSVEDAQAVADAIAAKMEDLGEDDKSTALKIALDVTQSGQTTATDLNLSADVVAALKDAAAEYGKELVVTVTSDTGTVQLPLGALEKAQDSDSTANVTLAVSTVDPSTLDSVTDDQGESVDVTALENAVIVDVTLKVGDQAATIKDLTEEIVITVATPSGASKVDVYFINTDNSLEHIGTYDVDDGEQVTFGVDHLTTFVVKEAESTPDDPGTVTPPAPSDDPCKDGHTGTAGSDGNCSACGKPMGGSPGGDEENPPAGQCPHGKDPAECEDCKAAGGDNPGGEGEKPDKPNPDDGKCEHDNDPTTCPICSEGSGNDGDDTGEPGTNPDDTTTKPGDNTGGDGKDPEGQGPGDTGDGTTGGNTGTDPDGVTPGGTTPGDTGDGKDPEGQEPGDKGSGEGEEDSNVQQPEDEAGDNKSDVDTKLPDDSSADDTKDGDAAGGVEAGQQSSSDQSSNPVIGEGGTDLEEGDQKLAA